MTSVDAFARIARTALVFAGLVTPLTAMADYKECKVIAKRGGAAAADWKFEAISADGKKTTICVKGQTINENAAKQACVAGEYDKESDCKNW